MNRPVALASLGLVTLLGCASGTAGHLAWSAAAAPNRIAIDGGQPLPSAAASVSPQADAATGERAPIALIPGLPEMHLDLQELQSEYDIPIEVNAEVIQQVRLFQSPAMHAGFAKWLRRSREYIPLLRRILEREGVPGDMVYVAMIESGFGNRARSQAHAVGPWQFTAATAKRMGLHRDPWIDERRDPVKATHAAARLLKELFAQTRDWRLAWAGYDAGIGRVLKVLHGESRGFWSLMRERGFSRETREYVPKLMAAAIIAKHPEAFGFADPREESGTWSEYAEVTIERSAPLSLLARAAACTERTLRELNPALLRGSTPPGPYVIRVPKGSNGALAREGWFSANGRATQAYSSLHTHPGMLAKAGRQDH